MRAMGRFRIGFALAVLLLVLVALVLGSVPAFAQVPIDRVPQIAQAVHDAERVNIGNGSTREYRNAFWARVVGIIHFGHPVYNPTPDTSWCIKDGGGGRPQSDDVIVQCRSRQFWDCIPGSGADGYRFSCSSDGATLPPEQNVYIPPRPAGGGATTTPTPTPGPLAGYWTDAHRQLVARIGTGSTQRAAAQLAFSYPGEGWGQKRTPSGPPSPDVIGRQVDGHLVGVRIGTNEVFYLDGQVFVPVTPTNYLGDAPAPPLPTPAPTPEPTPTPSPAPSTDLARVLEALVGLRQDVNTSLEGLLALVQAQAAELAVVREQLSNGFDIDATSKYLGKITGTIRPKAQ